MSLFNESYQEYYEIIDRAQTLSRVKINRDHPDYVYYESHHVIPRSLGGTDSWRNLVLLTPEEHYVCHSLLPDFCEGISRYNMLWAWAMMNGSKTIDGIVILGKEKYSLLKRSFSESIQGVNNPRSRAVCRLDKITGERSGRWDSTEEAAKDTLNAIQSNVASCCRGELLSTAGHLWCFEEDYNEGKIKELIDRANVGGPQAVCKLDMKTGVILETFVSIAAAEEETGLSGISNCCYGAANTSGGFCWCKLKDYSEVLAKELVAKANAIKASSKAVCRLDPRSGVVQEEYPSVTIASEETGINLGDISGCCLGRRLVVGESAWCFKSKYSEELVQSRLMKIKAKTKGIIRRDSDGANPKEYWDAVEAAKELQINAAGIRRCCRGEQQLYKDYQWSYAS